MTLRKAFGVATGFALLSIAGPLGAQDIPDPDAGPQAVVRLQESATVAGLLERLKASAPSHTILFRNVRVVDPIAARASDPRQVLVRDGKIAAIGSKISSPRGAFVIDGHGQYLAPGLTDSHFHSHSPAAPLVNLAYGVTTVREMDGFPWMLHWRGAARQRRMLAPYPYVVSRIINDFPMGGYAIAPKSVDDARTIVRQQAACGFEAIKVHNMVPLSEFDAIADEAKKVGLPVVGHVPHDIPVRHAAEAGMRTMEHLKGWLNDRNLELGDRDYKVASDFKSLWVVPTLYSTHQSLRGKDALAVLDGPEGAYIPPWLRSELRGMVNEAPNRQLISRQAQLPKMITIMRELHKVGARFLVGTDADGTELTIAGVGVGDEMNLMMSAGLSAPEVLRAATSEPAEAFRHSGEFGQIKAGMRADLVLLPRDPLDDPLTYRDNGGVMANGRWLSRSALSPALAQVRRLFAAMPDPANIDPRRLANNVRKLASAGYVFDAATLGNAAAAWRKAGATAAAHQIQLLADNENRCPVKP